MKRPVFKAFMVLLLGVTLHLAQAQTVTELVVPRYFGSKTGPTTNTARASFAVCIRIDGLLAGTSYDLKPGIGLLTDPATSYGAGNYWNGTTFSGTSSILNCFTTDAAGSSGPVWVFLQPTGNSSRFDAGQVHNLRIGWVIAGGAMPGSPQFVGTKTMTALDVAVTPRTSSTTDDGCFIKGGSLPPSNGKYMLAFDNEAGTGDPLFSYTIRPCIPTQASNSELPAVINDIYMQSGSSVAGDYPAVVPTGANNPSGVRRVESRNPDNTVFAFNLSSNGIWPSGANTTTALRRDVVTLTSTDTPLTPSGPGFPVVTTNTAVTNISFNSATGGGNVTNSGGQSITARGLCWSTGANPSIADPHTTEPGSTGPFNSNLTGLLPSTTYYVKAYATNATGTSYGSAIQFTTLCEIVAPLPDFSASKLILNPGESINFFDSTKFCPEAWSWSFVGGVPDNSTAQNPAGITYNFPGDYTVCLTATNQWGQQTTCKAAYIHVNGIPSETPLVMTEINYRSPLGGTDSLEFIEIYNKGNNTVNLQGCRFSRGIEFTFPAVDLAPQSYLLVAKSALWMANTYNVNALQWNAGSALSNAGEAVVLKDSQGLVVDSVFYSPFLPWDTMANGRGPSLELCDPLSNNLLPENWRHAVEYQGTTLAGDSLYASPLGGCAFLPVAGFIASDSLISIHSTVVFTDTSSGEITSWDWAFEGGQPETYSGQVPPPIQYFYMGSYDVTLTVTSSAGTSVAVKPGFIQVGPEGISFPDYRSGMNIHPNPARNSNAIVILPDGKAWNVIVHNAFGQQIFHIISGNHRVEIPSVDWPAGLYTIQAFSDKGDLKKQGKFIIQ